MGVIILILVIHLSQLRGTLPQSLVPPSLREVSPKVTEGVRILWLSDLDNHDFDFTMSLGSVQYLLRGR